MPGSLDSCINNVFEVGNIPASSGTPPVRVLLKDALEASVSEAAAADAVHDWTIPTIDAAISETAAADAVQDWVSGAPMDAMIIGAFVNSDGTSRQANVNGVMVNL